MNKLTKKLLFSTLLIIASNASHSDENSWYMLAKIGLAEPASSYDETNFNNTKWEFDNGTNFSFALGYTIDDFRIEGEASYRKFNALKRRYAGGSNDLSGNQTHTSLMVNGYWLPLKSSTFSPILGVGAGLTNVSWNNVIINGTTASIDDTDTVMTYKLLAGVEYQLSKKTSLQMAYTHLQMDDVQLTASTRTVGNMNNQTLNIIDFGIKYNF